VLEALTTTQFDAMFSGCQPRQVVQIHKTLQIPTPISIIRLPMKEYETSVGMNHVTRLSAREDFTEVIRKSPYFMETEGSLPCSHNPSISLIPSQLNLVYFRSSSFRNHPIYS